MLFRFNSLEKDESQKSKPEEHLSVNDWSEKECYLFSHGVLPLTSYQNNEVIRKVAKTQGSHLEFGKTQGWWKENKYRVKFWNAPISVLSWVSACLFLVFLPSVLTVSSSWTSKAPKKIGVQSTLIDDPPNQPSKNPPPTFPNITLPFSIIVFILWCSHSLCYLKPKFGYKIQRNVFFISKLCWKNNWNVRNHSFPSIFLPKLLKFFIKQPFEKVKRLILGLSLGEIFAVIDGASNQTLNPKQSQCFFFF